MHKMSEEWKPVVGFEGYYEVSSLGRIKRIKGGSGAKPGCCLIPYTLPNGYLRVMLYRNQVGTAKYIHHAVADAFIGVCPAGMERNHRDGNKRNNTPSNIEFSTHADNMAHARRLGLIKRGSQRRDAKLNECLARLIKLHLKTASVSDTAKAFCVPKGTVDNIKRGKCWAYVSM